MKRLFTFIIILIIQVASASTEIRLHSLPSKIKQGSLFQAKLLLDSESAQRLELQKLKGVNLGDSLYLYSVTPLMKKNDDKNFEADGSFIFTRPPEGQRLIHKLGSEELVITWPAFEFVPTEGLPDYFYETFTIPARFRTAFWVLIFILGISLSLLVRIFKKRYYQRILFKKKRNEFKSKLLSAKDYQEVVEIWKNKSIYLDIFPDIQDHFKALETVLYKYQFKPKQNESEQSEVLSSYKEFTQKIQGGKDGI